MKIPGLPEGWEGTATPMKLVDGKMVEIPENEIPEEARQDMLKFVANLNLGECELCHQQNERRPYGPKGEEICRECSIQNPAATYAAMRATEGPEKAEGFMQFMKFYQDRVGNADLSKMN